MLVIEGGEQEGSSNLIVSTDGAIISEERVNVVSHPTGLLTHTIAWHFVLFEMLLFFDLNWYSTALGSI